MVKKLLAALLLLSLTGCGQEDLISTSSLCDKDRQLLSIAEKNIEAEIACTKEQLATGLMYRKSLESNSGMLFLYPSEKILGFWMKNTYVPLSIAFLDENFVIIDIHNMEPLNETPIYSKKPAMYALEAPEGWFDNIPIGTVVNLKR